MAKKTEIIFVKNEQRESSLSNLKELLSYRFVIPLFQRPYSWDEDHFKDLLETIEENRNKDNREAFFGSIIVALKKDKGSGRPGKQKYFLIDGQQRITSFLLLLKFISNKLKSHIEEKDKDIKELTKLLNKAKSDGNTDLTQKYAEQRKDEESKKKDIKVQLEIIKAVLIKNRIQRESESSEPLEQDILKYIFSDQSIPQRKEIISIKTLFEQETDDMDDITHFLNYILDKCIFCFLTIEGDDSEDYAIDIFNSLNSTGEPLTSFEILKSLIYKRFATNRKIQQELTGIFDKIEKELNKKRMKKVRQNKYTDRLLLFLNMMTKGLQLEKISTFRDKKKLLDKILTLTDDQIKKCIEEMYSLHEFILNNWENKRDPFRDKDLHPEDQIMFNFLQSINHDRVLPILYHFRETVNLGDVIKICVAFTCLWRGYSSDGSTDRIDNKYENIIKDLFQKKPDIQDLKDNVLALLTKKNQETFKTSRMD